MKKLPGLILVIILTVPIIRPLFQRGYFPMHDDTQVGRVVVMGKALRWGQIPVRWVSDLGYGYGYPLYNFYGPLPYYVGGFLHALGIPGLIATKIMMAMGMIGAGIVMYLFVAGFMGTLPAIAAAVFYAYAPYHAVQLYVRGAVGELWTLVFYPLILWGILAPRKSTGYGARIGGLGVAGIIVSHTLLGFATSILLMAGLAIFHGMSAIGRKFQRSVFTYHLHIMVIGLGLSAFFWLPAISEMHFTSVAGQVSQTADFHDHFVCLSQLWSSQWGFGGSAKGCVDGLSFSLGKIHVLAGLIGVAALLFLRNAHGTHGVIAKLGLFITAVGIFFMTRPSQILWEYVPGLPFLQYPWRFLAITGVGLSLLAGSVISRISGAFPRALVAGMLVVLVIGVYAKRFQPQYLYDRPMADFEATIELRTKVSRLSDEYLPGDFVRPLREDDYAKVAMGSTETMKIRTLVNTDTYSRFAIVAARDDTIEVKQVFFPGLEFTVNGMRQSPEVRGGLPTIRIPKGESIVEMRFTNTPIRSAANIITILTVAGLLLFYGKKTNN